MAEKEHSEHKGRSAGHGAHGGGSHEEHEGAPEWLISFADNVVLMMGFFVILLAMNMKAPNTGGVGGEGGDGVPRDDMLDFVIGVRRAFNNPVSIDSSDPNDQMLVRRLRERSEGTSRQPGDPGSQRESQAIRWTDYSSLGGTVAFEDGATALSPRGRELAAEIGARMRGLRWMIEVRGHASPSETFQDPEKAIAIAHARALAVARALAAAGVEWDRVRLVACGDNERKVQRTYDRIEDRQNQRVDIVVTQEPSEP